MGVIKEKVSPPEMTGGAKKGGQGKDHEDEETTIVLTCLLHFFHTPYGRSQLEMAKRALNRRRLILCRDLPRETGAQVERLMEDENEQCVLVQMDF